MSVSVRSEFPALERKLHGKPIVYLDTAATAFKPRAVLDAEARFLASGAANIHRGKHALSEEASEAYEAARDSVARFVNARSPSEVIFVRNTTEALNVVARGLSLSKDDEVIALPVEHHSNLLPWMRAARVVWVEADPRRPVDPAALSAALTPRTKVVVIGHASNVTGVVQPVADICRMAREAGVLTMVDAAQSVPHIPVDVQDLGCDFLGFSAHKAYGPTGIGVLYGREPALERLEPTNLGGGTVDRVWRDGYALRALPQRLEGGTPHISGAVGLSAALRFLAELGMREVAAHGAALAEQLSLGLSRQGGIEVLQAEAPARLPLATVRLLTTAVSADDVAMMLSDQHAVMARTGFHCAHPLFAAQGIDQGTLRVSCGVYTESSDLDRFFGALAQVLRPFLGRST